MHTALAELAAHYGIQTQYHRIDGSLCVAKPEVILAILTAMGCPITRIEDAGDALRGYRETPRATATAASQAMAFTHPGKKWGTFLPLYAARSSHHWGAGDFTDLQKMAEWTAKHGGTVLGTLPLLPTKWEKHQVPSPYAPWSRLFWNPFYIDCTTIPELTHCPAAQTLIGSPEFQDAIATCRATARVDYHTIMALKERVLHLLAQTFFTTQSERRAQFDRYVHSHPDLIPYCDFLAAATPRPSPWRDWLPRLLGLKITTAQYHQYVQWIADQQLAHAADHARAHGVRLYLDFPIGAHPDGYDAWRYKDLFVPKMRIGAPPDPFFDQGQDWGFQPLHPLRLHEGGLDYWTRCIRHHMQVAGALRLDHVMGLHRQFWIPEGFTAQDGVYVNYPAEDFYAVLCRESQHYKTIVIGEDLGTVPPEVRTAMQAHGLLRMHILQFDPAFEYTTSIPSHCLAALNTHDMPPFAAHWGVRPDPAEALKRHLHCIARSPAEIALINIEDLWLETEPQNRPGTVSPNNWSHRAQLLIEDFDRNPDIVNLLQQFDQLRREVT